MIPCTPDDSLHRLCDPYITTTILEDTFGELAHEVASKYLVEYQKGRYRLREEYYRSALCLHTQPVRMTWLTYCFLAMDRYGPFIVEDL